MKRIKLFFLTFLSVCLGLTSFSSANTVEVPFNIYNDPGASYSVFPSNTYLYFNSPYLISWDGTPLDFCITLSGYNSSFLDYTNPYFVGLNAQVSASSISSLNANRTVNAGIYEAISLNDFLTNSYCDTLSVSNSYSSYNFFNINYFRFILSSSQENFSTIDNPYFNGILTLSGNVNIVSGGGSSVDCSQDSNYRQCLEDKNQLIGQVSTLSGSLRSCQSDLSDCRGGQDASLLACIDQKEQCETSLTTLSGNYVSLENMNSSLSSQLQECLENSSLSGDLICNKFDLFWSSDNTNYSFPINNDLILPPGYKGFVNEGVLAIKPDSSLDSAYSIDDEEFQDVIDSYGVVFLYMFGSSLFLVFLYMIRKYFIGLKS